jgi:hypothetical protein
MAQALRRLVQCGNCKAKFPHEHAMSVLLGNLYKDPHQPLLQSMVDGFSSYPLKQMKSVGYQLFSPENRICDILKRSAIPCPKCNKIHWQ